MEWPAHLPLIRGGGVSVVVKEKTKMSSLGVRM